MAAKRDPRSGFTMVEVIFAVMILAVGLLGMAGTTALVVQQVTAADLSTERSAALQTAIEQIKATPFDQLTDGSDSVGVFEVSWSVSKAGGNWAVVQVVTNGPGMKPAEGGGFVLNPHVSDSFTHRILR
jgi:prepilin-type N-terminal cleavage/methylation domain-containing protein